MNENYNVEEDEGVSLGEIFSWIWLKKIWFLGLTLGVTLIIGLVFVFGINPSKAKYNVTFSYEDVRNLDEGSYLDGTKFDFHQVIGEKNIKEVITLDKKYESINVSELVNDNDFTIERNIVRAKKDDLSSEIVAITYEINVPAKYFDNGNLATNFFYDLVNLPVQYNEQSLDLFKFDQNLINAHDSKTFETELIYIENQTKYLKTQYEDMIKEFGDIMVYFSETSNDGVTVKNARLSSLLTSFESTVKAIDIESLKEDLKVNLYVKDYDYTMKPIENKISIIDKDIKKIDEQLVALNAKLDALMQQSTNLGISQAISDVISKIAQLEADKFELEADKKDLNDTKINYSEAKSKAYESDLNMVLKTLENETNIYKNAFKYVHMNDQLVQFKHPTIAKKTGTFNIIIVGGIALVLGLVTGATVSGILGHKEAKKTLKAKKEEE